LKAELLQQKDRVQSLSDKLKYQQTIVKDKDLQIERLLRNVPTDPVARREESESAKQQKIRELEQELYYMEKENKDMLERMNLAEEKNLELRYEFENFDVKASRLEKHIQNLEGFKLRAAQLSANNKNAFEKELEMIKDDTEKLRGDSLTRQPGDSIKLKPKKHRTVPELEALVDQLKRVIEKQRVEKDDLDKQIANLGSKVQKGSKEPALRK